MTINDNFSADHTGSRAYFLKKHGYRSTDRGSQENVRIRVVNGVSMTLPRAVQAKIICNSNKLKITQMLINRGLI